MRDTYVKTAAMWQETPQGGTVGHVSAQKEEGLVSGAPPIVGLCEKGLYVNAVAGGRHLFVGRYRFTGLRGRTFLGDCCSENFLGMVADPGSYALSGIVGLGAPTLVVQRRR